jgi:peptide/nickel transport system ATP-binding protein
METGMERLIHAEKLNVCFQDSAVVRNVSFELCSGELLALVGESGSGKTLLCRALLGLPPKGAEVTHDVLVRPKAAEMSLVMQDAMTALDPAMPVGKQIAEANRRCPYTPAELLRRVGIDHAEAYVRRYPGEFSGGMRQRAAIAIALAMSPKVIFADEPTTSLDADMRLKIMGLLDRVRRDGTAILFVTHDLGLVRDFADRVLIMKDGAIIERGKTADIFAMPKQAYTKELLRYAAISDPSNHTHGKIHYHDTEFHSHAHSGRHTHQDDGHQNPDLEPESTDRYLDTDRPADKPCYPHVHTPSSRAPKSTDRHPDESGRSPLISANALSKSYPLGMGKTVKALATMSLDIFPGEIVGLCGRSGIGKSTFARCLAGLEAPSKGERGAQDGLNIQMIFQDSVSALNPRMSAGQLIAEPLYLRDGKKPAPLAIEALMRETELEAALIDRRPHELSGGQRQRVAIARAIATRPDLIIADEPVSSLDVTTCSKIIHLLKRLRDEHDLTILLISHDLHLLTHVSDRIVSMQGDQSTSLRGDRSASM